MDGGERIMIKKILITLCAVFMIFSASFTSFAEKGDEFYDEYDNYEELEDDYYQSIGIPEQVQNDHRTQPWYANLSVVPLIVGLVAGSLTVLILFRKHSIARRHIPEHPYPYALDIKHTIVSDKTDNTL